MSVAVRSCIFLGLDGRAANPRFRNVLLYTLPFLLVSLKELEFSQRHSESTCSWFLEHYWTRCDYGNICFSIGCSSIQWHSASYLLLNAFEIIRTGMIVCSCLIFEVGISLIWVIHQLTAAKYANVFHSVLLSIIYRLRRKFQLSFRSD